LAKEVSSWKSKISAKNG